MIIPPSRNIALTPTDKFMIHPQTILAEGKAFLVGNGENTLIKGVYHAIHQMLQANGYLVSGTFMGGHTLNTSGNFLAIDCLHSSKVSSSNEWALVVSSELCRGQTIFNSLNEILFETLDSNTSGRQAL